MSNEPTVDTAALRGAAEAIQSQFPGAPFSASVLALLDRLERAEAELYVLRQAIITPECIGTSAGVPIYSCRMCEGVWHEFEAHVHWTGCPALAAESALREIGRDGGSSEGAVQ